MVNLTKRRGFFQNYQKLEFSNIQDLLDIALRLITFPTYCQKSEQELVNTGSPLINCHIEKNQLFPHKENHYKWKYETKIEVFQYFQSSTMHLLGGIDLKHKS